MLLEVRSVGRKTPLDGRLEVTPATARRVALLGTPVSLLVGESAGLLTVESMPCGCAREAVSGGGAHEHHFLTAALFRNLLAGETVCIELLENGTVTVSRSHEL